ncbi:MAG TPA: hypothetical protein VLC28_00355 [Flavitalea sp.]|nr:hypothetical protein [Flavitalea sp.]
MKYFLGLCLLCLFGSEIFAQKSDFIVIRNKQRTVRTYFAGSYINADTYAGFTLNGIIKKIAHDSLYVEQENVYQVATQFGTPALDTVRYFIPIYYKEIRKFNYELDGSRQRGGSSLLLPKILLYGGTGYIVLELVNTAYRNESLNEGNKLTSLAIAGGVALTGLIWQESIKSKQRKGKKVTVEYIKMSE